MATKSTTARVLAVLDPRPVSWVTVALLTVALTYADGFVLTVLTSAVGSIQRTQSPFSLWLVDSTILLPLFLLAILVAFRLARHRLDTVLWKPRQVLTTALLVALAGTIIGVGAAVGNGAYNYYLQANELQATGPVHADHLGAGGAAGQTPGHDHDECDIVCQQQQATLVADLKAVGFGGPLMLALNLVVVGWMVALIGGRLTADEGETEPATGRSPAVAAGVPTALPPGRP